MRLGIRPHSLPRMRPQFKSKGSCCLSLDLFEGGFFNTTHDTRAERKRKKEIGKREYFLKLCLM